jgi:transglutaminase-like putative cysteine protease
MRLNIHHETHYSYDATPAYLVQRLQLQPIDFNTQRALSWAITAPGFETGLAYTDGFGNRTHLITMFGHVGDVVITASGEVETQDASGLVKGLPSTVPDVVYLRHTPTTQAGAALVHLAESVSKQGDVVHLTSSPQPMKLSQPCAAFVRIMPILWSQWRATSAFPPVTSRDISSRE